MLGQLATLIYNLADIYFVSLTKIAESVLTSRMYIPGAYGKFEF